MHSFLSRANAVAAYALSVLACLTFMCFLSTLFIDYRTEASINTVKAIVKSISNYNSDRQTNDLGHITIDLKAEYETPSNSLNQVILWDKIIKRGDKANLNLKNINVKYYFWDDGAGLKGNKNITLTLSWNVIPNAGCLPHVNAIGQRSFSFPNEYTVAKQ